MNNSGNKNEATTIIRDIRGSTNSGSTSLRWMKVHRAALETLGVGGVMVGMHGVGTASGLTSWSRELFSA